MHRLSKLLNKCLLKTQKTDAFANAWVIFAGVIAEGRGVTKPAATNDKIETRMFGFESRVETLC